MTKRTSTARSKTSFSTSTGSSRRGTRLSARSLISHATPALRPLFDHGRHGIEPASAIEDTITDHGPKDERDRPHRGQTGFSLANGLPRA